MNITAEEYNEINDKHERLINIAKSNLNSLIGDSRLSNGLTPDHIKNTNEYKEAKKEYNVLMSQIKTFRMMVSNKIKREAANLRRKV